MEIIKEIIYALLIVGLAGIGCFFGVKLAAKEVRKVLGNITLKIENTSNHNVNFEDKEQMEEFYSALKKYVEDETNLKNHS